MSSLADMRVLGLIPARGGSKRLPGKNLRMFDNKPLIAWTIEVALNADAVSDVVVSTDDQEIADAARQYGAQVPFMRPDELANDEVSSVAVALHALESLDTDYDAFVLLQPTSPLRGATDIDQAFALMHAQNVPQCVSLKPGVGKEGWIYSLSSQTSALLPADENQDSYTLNGALYFSDVAYFKAHERFITDKTCGYVMPEERSVDIDDIHDFERAIAAHKEAI